jgi:hypothetical protein
LLCLVLLAWLLAGVAQAQSVEAEGTALIDGSVGVAKRLAMQDAIRQALMQAGSQVSTTTVVSSRGVVSDNVRFTARGRVTHVVVLEEWTDEGNYYVRIRAQVPGGMVPERPASVVQAVSSKSVQRNMGEMVNAYRRNVAVTQFHVLDRTQIADLPDIEVALSRELKRRLDADGRVRTVDAAQYLLPLGDNDIVSQRRIFGALPQARNAEQTAIEFADSLGVQFVATGVIRDMGVTEHLLGARLRHLELELVLHDGITGEEVARHRVNESVQDAGLLDFQITTPVLNDKFYASAFGRKVDRVLDKLVSMVVSDLTTQPFSARVIRTEGKQVFFDAGGSANVKIGDVLNAYQLAQAPVSDLPRQRALGYPEKPTSILVVTQVQRLFSVGELGSDTARLAPGDVIRFEP